MNNIAIAAVIIGILVVPLAVIFIVETDNPFVPDEDEILTVDPHATQTEVNLVNYIHWAYGSYMCQEFEIGRAHV